MKYLLIVLLTIPFISSGQTSLFYERPAETIATKDTSKTIGLDINTSFLQSITENSSEFLNIIIPFIDGSIELTLHKFSIVKNQLLIISKTSSGEERSLITPTVLSYKVFYEDKNIGVLNVVNNNVVATFTINNKQYEISKFNNKYLLFEASNSINESNFSCQVENQYNSINVESNLLINVCVELAIEIDYYTRQTFNSNLETINWALAIIAGVSQLYEAQTNASISVVNISLWEIIDPYASIVNDASYMLSEIKSYWQTNNNSITRDLVHLLSKRSNTGTGGIAYLNGLCSNNSGYGFSSAMNNDTTYSFPNPTYTWNLMVVTHEIGHNFGANHTHWCGWTADPLYSFIGGGIDDCGVVSGSSNACNPPAPSPPGGIGTIMSYCHNGGSGIALNFHDIVLSQALTPGISSASCLTTCGEGCTDSLAFNYNPYSYIDNGTCCYIAGCTNPVATNYNPNACVDDGVCLFPPVSFCDDFESYQNGDPIAETSADWETWGSIVSPNPPYYDDAAVTNTLSSSGTNSLYFIGIGSGGPQDIVLPFGTGGPYTHGYFNFSANFYITNSAYFNFQAEQIPGISWTTSIFFNNSGDITISNSNPSLDSCHYIQNVWFEFKFEIDLTNNTWEVFIDGVSQGSFSNTVNQIASLDLYPTQGDEFYVDDVCFEFSNTPIGQIIGCTDSLACNFDTLATFDDGSCAYPTSSYITRTECDSYLWNDTIYNSTGIYNWNGTNSLGCDSIATLDLTINYADTSYISSTACDSYTWNGATYTSSGTYTWVGASLVGCDSIVIIELVIINSPIIFNTQIICQGESYSVGVNVYTSPGIYLDTLETTSGCDSIITTNLTVIPNIYQNQYIELCEDDSVQIGNNTYTNNGIYNDTLISISGCDSILTTQVSLYYFNLIIDYNTVNLSVNLSGGNPPFTFIWNTNETTQSITPQTNGLYWCVATDISNCTSDTASYNIDNINSIKEYSLTEIEIFPNPTNGILNIEFNNKFNGNILLQNILGELIFKNSNLEAKKDQMIQIDLSSFSKGIYIIRIVTENEMINQKLIFE